MQAAIGAGLASRVHAQVGDLSSWTPDAALNAVIVSQVALHGLSAVERARVIEVLQDDAHPCFAHPVRGRADAGVSGRANAATSPPPRDDPHA